jgi:Beta-lactamase class C and other penicillin binding proteins
VTELTIQVDPAELGLDKERLKRIDAHFAGYVEDGRLAGWLLTVSRHGRLAHVARCGSRDLEAGLPVTDDTLWRIYSMTKPITSVAAMISTRRAGSRSPTRSARSSRPSPTSASTTAARTRSR